MAESNLTTKQLKLASWNVNGMDKVDKLDYVLDTLSRYEIDIGLLQETKVWDAFDEQYKEYTLLIPKQSQKKKKQIHGVAIAVKNNLKTLFELKEVSIEISHRIMHGCLRIENINIHFINVYAPVNERKRTSSRTKKNSEKRIETNKTDNGNESDENEIAIILRPFYEHLQTILSHVPENDLVFLFGDLNAHIGTRDANQACLGDYCIEVTQNANGKRLIEFCTKNKLCIVNTFFEHEAKETHYNKGTKKWFELDFLITRLKDRDLVIDIQSNIELVYTDHCIVVSTIDINIANVTVETPAKLPLNIDLKMLLCLLSIEEFTPELVPFDLKNNWDTFKECIKSLYGYDLNELIRILKQHHPKNNRALREIREYTSSKNSETQLNEKTNEVVSLINNCSQQLIEHRIQCLRNRPTLKEIKDSLKEGISKNDLELQFDSKIQLPSLKELDDAIGMLDETKKYTFLRPLLHSLSCVIFKYRQVPIEMYCFSILNPTEEQSKIPAFIIAYNVISCILKARSGLFF